MHGIPLLIVDEADLNQLDAITVDVVEAARVTLVIGT